MVAGGSQLRVGSLAVKWAQLAVGSPKAPQSPQFSDPVRILELHPWAHGHHSLQLCFGFPSGSTTCPSFCFLLWAWPPPFLQITAPTPVPPGALLPTREIGSPSGKTGARWTGWRGVSAEVGAPARPPSDLTFHQLTGNPHALGTPKKDSCNPKGRFKMQGVSSVSRKRDAGFLPATVRVELATFFMQDKLLPLSRFSSSQEREVPAVETQVRTAKS